MTKQLAIRTLSYNYTLPCRNKLKPGSLWSKPLEEWWQPCFGPVRGPEAWQLSYHSTSAVTRPRWEPNKRRSVQSWLQSYTHGLQGNIGLPHPTSTNSGMHINWNQYTYQPLHTMSPRATEDHVVTRSNNERCNNTRKWHHNTQKMRKSPIVMWET